jgi:hypothetical protein
MVYADLGGDVVQPGVQQVSYAAWVALGDFSALSFGKEPVQLFLGSALGAVECPGDVADLPVLTTSESADAQRPTPRCSSSLAHSPPESPSSLPRQG